MSPSFHFPIYNHPSIQPLKSFIHYHPISLSSFFLISLILVSRNCRGKMGIRQGLHVRGRKKKAKLCLAKKANAGKSTSLQKKFRELQRTIPGQELNMHNLFQSIQKYIFLLEAKVTILRCLSNSYGV